VSTTFGQLRSVWDGPVLYLLVEVHDATRSRAAATDTGLRQDANNNPALREGARAENAYNRYFGGYQTVAPWKDYRFPRRLPADDA
jgi:hypothetical protein